MVVNTNGKDITWYVVQNAFLLRYAVENIDNYLFNNRLQYQTGYVWGISVSDLSVHPFYTSTTDVGLSIKYYLIRSVLRILLRQFPDQRRRAHGCDPSRNMKAAPAGSYLDLEQFCLSR